ncbi:asparagine synthase-related protein [Salinibacillus xinjiangensis]|uniref:asparagine synthase (glutamine-hydrolyzing) n=1 Tax=Salinibacillus xinjiangensis TaxID=1229268 RepID=A0A6G1X2F5_9BACI|nr:asparagine synthase-related protein [Salinibacillus xinjiangensis]MRG85080.1 hypothetical protein [Salinibacillus xinjiangensis]
MHVFLGVQSKRNVEISQDLLQNISNRGSIVLGIDTPPKLWKSEKSNIIVSYWTNEGIHQMPNERDFAFTLSGYTSSNIQDMYKRLKDSSTYKQSNMMISNINGLYAGIFANSKKNYLQAWNTVTRVEPLYWAEDDQYTYISNRALLLHLISTNRETPNYKLENLVPFLHNGYYNSDFTPYENVNVLPPNSTIITTPEKTVIEDIDDALGKQYSLEQPTEQFYDDITQDFINSFKVINENHTPINAAITGGKDSRLIVAALKYINADFKTYTFGYDENPDVIVGKKISDLLQLEHSVTTPATKENQSGFVVQDILSRTTNILSFTDGMLTAYENVSSRYTFDADKVILGGHGGEHLRGGYNRVVREHNRKGLETLIFRKLNLFNELINKENQDTYEEQLNQWLQKRSHYSPVDLMTRYFIEYRTGRWSAAARTGFNYNYHLYQPFFDSNLNKSLLKIPSEFLINDEVIYNILLRLAPELVDVPFNSDRWKFEKDGPLAGQEKQWERRTPITAKQQSKGSFNWRRTTLSDMKQAMMEEIFSNASSDIFNIVNRNEVEALFNNQSKINNKEIDVFVWNLYTASVLLSNKWLAKNKPSRKVEIDLPATKTVLEKDINFHDFKINTNTKNLKVKVGKSKLIAKYNHSSTGQNLYIQTMGGKFTTPPHKKYKSITTLGDYKEYKIDFMGSSKKSNQKIILFFMAYDENKRIYNQSVTFNLTNQPKNFSYQFKPPKEATNFKFAIKVVQNKEKKEKLKIENMVLSYLI